jgi:hypothetical protein
VIKVTFLVFITGLGYDSRKAFVHVFLQVACKRTQKLRREVAVVAYNPSYY